MYTCINIKYFFIEVNLNRGLILIDINIYFLIDWIRIFFIFTVYFISGIVIFYSRVYISEDKLNLKFLILVVMFVLSINLIILCTNIFIIILGWDGLGLVSYCLVIFFNNENSSRAGMLTVITNRLGDAGLILRIVLIVNFGA